MSTLLARVELFEAFSYGHVFGFCYIGLSSSPSELVWRSWIFTEFEECYLRIWPVESWAEPFCATYHKVFWPIQCVFVGCLNSNVDPYPS